MQGVSTRKIEKLAQKLGIESISRSQVSEMTKGLNEQAEAFRNRSLEGESYPVIWVDALYEKVRYGGHVVNMAILLVCGVREDGHREVLAIEPMLEEGLEDSLIFFDFPSLDSRKISSNNMIERLNKEIRRRTRVIGIFPNPESYVRLVTIYLMEYSEDWSVSRSYLSEASIAKIQKLVA